MENGKSHSGKSWAITLLNRGCKKILIGINERYSQYKKNKKITMSPQKLEYAIKTTTKKVNEIQEQIKANSGRKETPLATIVQSKNRCFQDILASSKKLQYLLPNFKALKSHPSGSPITPTIIPQSPVIEDAELTAHKKKSTGGKDYSFLFAKARVGGNGSVFKSNVNNTLKGIDNKRSQRHGDGSWGPPDGQDSDDDNEGENNGKKIF